MTWLVWMLLGIAVSAILFGVTLLVAWVVERGRGPREEREFHRQWGETDEELRQRIKRDSGRGRFSADRVRRRK